MASVQVQLVFLCIVSMVLIRANKIDLETNEEVTIKPISTYISHLKRTQEPQKEPAIFASTDTGYSTQYVTIGGVNYRMWTVDGKTGWTDSHSIDQEFSTHGKSKPTLKDNKEMSQMIKEGAPVHIELTYWETPYFKQMEHMYYTQMYTPVLHSTHQGAPGDGYPSIILIPRLHFVTFKYSSRLEANKLYWYGVSLDNPDTLRCYTEMMKGGGHTSVYKPAEWNQFTFGSTDGTHFVKWAGHFRTDNKGMIKTWNWHSGHIQPYTAWADLFRYMWRLPPTQWRPNKERKPHNGDNVQYNFNKNIWEIVKKHEITQNQIYHNKQKSISLSLKSLPSDDSTESVQLQNDIISAPVVNVQPARSALQQELDDIAGQLKTKFGNGFQMKEIEGVDKMDNYLQSKGVSDLSTGLSKVKEKDFFAQSGNLAFKSAVWKVLNGQSAVARGEYENLYEYEENNIHDKSGYEWKYEYESGYDVQGYGLYHNVSILCLMVIDFILLVIICLFLICCGCIVAILYYGLDKYWTSKQMVSDEISTEEVSVV